MQELFDSFKRIKGLEKVMNLTARQQRLIGLNALSLRVLTGKIDECRKIISKERSGNGETKNGDSSNGLLTEEGMILVEAGILFRQKKMKECSDLLASALKTNPKMTQLSIAKIYLLIKNKNFSEAAQMIHKGKKISAKR